MIQRYDHHAPGGISEMVRLDSGRYVTYPDHVREMKRVRGALRVCTELLLAAGHEYPAARAILAEEEA